MNRPRIYLDRVSTSLRLERDLYAALVNEARRRVVSQNYLIEQAIIDWLRAQGVIVIEEPVEAAEATA